MSTTTSADVAAVSGTLSSSQPPSIADAGRAFLETLSPEQRATEFEQDDLLETDAHTATPAPATGPTGATEAPATTATTDDAASAAAPITREDGATWNVDAGRWQNAAGQFVGGEAPANAPAAVAPSDGDFHTVTLPAREGETELTFEIDDPAIVERINRMKSAEGRARSLQRQASAVQAQAAELQELDQYLNTDPVGFVVGRMKPDLRLNVARALLLEHFDQLSPDIEAFLTDPARRQERRVELRDSMRESSDMMAQNRQWRAHAQACITAVEAMIPETADDESAQSFVADARNDLARLATAGQDVRPETVPTLLAQRAKLYGFTAPGTRDAAPVAAVPATRTPSPSAPAAARPVSDRARSIAAQAPSKVDAARSQATVRRVQTQRTAATRVAPPGAGAAPVQVPLLPPEAKRNINAASKYIRQKGLPESWDSVAR